MVYCVVSAIYQNGDVTHGVVSRQNNCPWPAKFATSPTPTNAEVYMNLKAKRDKIPRKLWSSQLWTQFVQLRIQKPEKFRISTGFEPLTSRYRCDALTNWAMKPRTFIPNELIRTHKWPTPNVRGFIAQLVRASHRYREVTGWNPVEVLNFSGFYIRNYINCVHSCEDHSLLDFTSAVLYLSLIHIWRCRRS